MCYIIKVAAKRGDNKRQALKGLYSKVLFVKLPFEN